MHDYSVSDAWLNDDSLTKSSCLSSYRWPLTPDFRLPPMGWLNSMWRFTFTFTFLVQGVLCRVDGVVNMRLAERVGARTGTIGITKYHMDILLFPREYTLTGHFRYKVHISHTYCCSLLRYRMLYSRSCCSPTYEMKDDTYLEVHIRDIHFILTYINGTICSCNVSK